MKEEVETERGGRGGRQEEDDEYKHGGIRDRKMKGRREKER